MKTKFKVTLVCAALSLLVILTGSCTAAAPEIQIESPEAALSPMMTGVASVFMKISNSGGGDVLTGVRTDIAGTIAELHDVKDGKMIKVDDISVPRDGTVVLQPGRLHIMIFKLPKDMKAGAQFSLFLTFKKSGEKTVQLELGTFSPGPGIHK